MTEVGFKILGSNHPISPVLIGNEETAKEIADELLLEGSLIFIQILRNL